MSPPRAFKLYVNAKGRAPMQLLKEISEDELPATEHEVAQAVEAVVEIINSFPREIESQVVIVQDGLIVAVEGLMKGKLMWCN